MKQKIKDFGNKILNLMYPKNIKCMFCAEELNQNSYNCTCENCLNILPFIKHACEKCGSPMNDNQQGVCIKCKRNNFNFAQAKSVFAYEDAVVDVVHGIKYSGKKYLIEHVTKYLVDVYATWNVFADFITFVPLFETREKQRGFNQSKVMAKMLAQNCNVSFLDCCVKCVDTPSQTSLNTLERLENVKDSFALIKDDKDKIKGKTILIVDDVITTGATTSELSKLLIENGAKECFILTFAHTKINQIDFEN